MPAPLRHRRIALALAATLVSGVPALPAVARIEQDDRDSYVYFAPRTQSSMMSGSTEDWQRAHAVRKGKEGLLYYRHGSEAFVIRDAATLQQAAAVLAPQRALGEQQAQLGSRQAELGRRQARLGAEQASLGGRGDAARVTALGRQQNALGEQQSALGKQQDALGREQDRVAREANAKLRALVDDAVRRGTAQRVD